MFVKFAYSIKHLILNNLLYSIGVVMGKPIDMLHGLIH